MRQKLFSLFAITLSILLAAPVVKAQDDTWDDVYSTRSQRNKNRQSVLERERAQEERERKEREAWERQIREQQRAWEEDEEDSSTRGNYYYYGDDEYDYNEYDVDRYNGRNGRDKYADNDRRYKDKKPYGRSKKRLGKYGSRLARFHSPTVIVIDGAYGVDVYYNDSYYTIYDNCGRYSYYDDYYNPVAIGLNWRRPGWWYSSWDFFYDYWFFQSYYPWYSAYPPIHWGPYRFWGYRPHPAYAWYPSGWRYSGWGYGAGYHNGYYDGFYTGYYYGATGGIYDPYDGVYYRPARQYAYGRSAGKRQLNQSRSSVSNTAAHNGSITVGRDRVRNTNYTRGAYWSEPAKRERAARELGTVDRRRNLNSRTTTTTTNPDRTRIRDRRVLGSNETEVYRNDRRSIYERTPSREADRTRIDRSRRINSSRERDNSRIIRRTDPNISRQSRTVTPSRRGSVRSSSRISTNSSRSYERPSTSSRSYSAPSRSSSGSSSSRSSSSSSSRSGGSIRGGR